MSNVLAQNLNYDRPIKLADDVYWVGFSDPERGLSCNPYLIIDGDEGILIDGGSRPEFSVVMMKILQTALAPGQISTLIYQHYDPDLCGSVANLEAIIDRPDLRVISKREGNVFIRYYGVHAKLLCIDDLDHKLVLASGRTLRFIPTPYAHTAGSFMTYDEKTGILFTSDLLGSFDTHSERELFREMPAECLQCTRSPVPHIRETCERIAQLCPLSSMLEFHRVEMPSNRALRLACEKIRAVQARIIAPQHGSIWHRPEDVAYLLNRLASLEDVGIDGIVDG